MGPRETPLCLRVILEREDFNVSLPYCLAPENFMHGNRSEVIRLATVHMFHCPL